MNQLTEETTDTTTCENVANDTTCFLALPRIYLNHTALLSMVLGTESHLSDKVVSPTSGNSRRRQSEVSVYRTRSLEHCLAGVMATFIHSHLKMAKPRKMSKTHTSKRIAASGSSRRLSARGESFRDLSTGTNATQQSEEPLSPLMSPVASRDSSPIRSRLYSAPVETESTDASPPGSGPQSTSNSIVGSTTVSRSSSGLFLESPSGIASPTSNRKSSLSRGLTSPMSASQTTPRDGIAFDASMLVSPRVTASCVLPSVDEVALHIGDYAVFFDDSELLKKSDISPLRKYPPEGLVKIAGVAADQITVFYEPKFTASK
eukprot:gene24699-31073_t